MTTGIDPTDRVRELVERIRDWLDDLGKRILSEPQELTAMKLHDWLAQAHDIVDHYDRDLPPAPYIVVHHIDRLPAICKHALTTEVYADRPITYVAPTELEAGDIADLVNIGDHHRAELRVAFGGAVMRLSATVTCPSCRQRTAARLLVPTDRNGHIERKCRQCDYGWRQWPAFA